MLTNNKKSFFVKGIALLMAMLMVLSVCLTGCGKAAEEAAKNAQTSADAADKKAEDALTAADAVKKDLEKYFTSEQTKAEAEKLIEEALKSYATTEALAAFVKSEDFKALAAQLSDYAKADAVNAAIAEALEGKVSAADLDRIQDELVDKINKNQTAISDAVTSLSNYLTASQIAVIQKELSDKIAATDKAVTEALRGYVTSTELTAIRELLELKITQGDQAATEALKNYLTADQIVDIQKALEGKIADANKAAQDALKSYLTADQIADIQKALEDKIAAGDKAAADALADYLTAEEVADIQKTLEDKIAATDKAIEDTAASLAGYVKNDADYQNLLASIREMNDKLMFIDRNHYQMVVETLAPYVEEQGRLADSVAELFTKISTIDKEHNDHLNEVLAGYVTTEDYEWLADSVQGLALQLQTIDKEHNDRINALLAGYVTNEDYEQLADSVQGLALQLQTIDHDHNVRINELLAGYVTNEDYKQLADSVKGLAIQLQTIDKEHNDRINALLAGYVTTEDYELLADSVAELFTKISTIDKEHNDRINELLAGFVSVETFELLTDRVQVIEAAMDEIADHVKAIEAEHGAVLDGLKQQLWQEEENRIAMGKEIQSALVGYALRIENLEGRMDRLEEVVKAILSAFYTPEEVKTFAEEGFDILNVDPAIIAVQFQNKMNTVDGSMSLSDWNATTTKILVETIDKIQTLLKRIYRDNFVDCTNTTTLRDAYLFEDKQAINDALKVTANEGKTVYMWVEVFDEENYGALNNSYTVQKALEYAVLRAANGAQLAQLSAALDAAIAVKPFAEKLEDLYNEYLYTIGCDDETHHHGTQIVTVEHKGELNTFADELDKLIIAYRFDNVNGTLVNEFLKNTNGYGDYGEDYSNRYNYNRSSNAGYGFGRVSTMGVYSFAGKLWTIADTAATVTRGLEIYTRVGDTIIHNGINFQEWKLKDAYGLYYVPSNLYDFKFTDANVGDELANVKVDGFHGSQTDITVSLTEDACDTYQALILQSKYAQDLIDFANAQFKKFLDKVVKQYGVTKSVADFAAAGVDMNVYATHNFAAQALTETGVEIYNLDAYQDVALNAKNLDGSPVFANIDAVKDMQFLYALVVDMCIPVAEPKIDGIIEIYLTGADSVQEAYEAALARNTCNDADHNDTPPRHSDALKNDFMYRYDLYQKMIEKAWFLTFELYRTYAFELSAKILNDYISVLDYAVANPTVDPNATELLDIDSFLAGYDINKNDGNLSAGFLKAFLNGDDTVFKGWKSHETTQAAIEISKIYEGKVNDETVDLALHLYYGDLNKTAYDPNGNLIEADPVATIVAEAEEIRQFLHSASVYPMIAIGNADRAAAYKNNRNNIAAVFVEILKSCIEGYDEVYSRFLMEDYQKVQLNKAWDYALNTADFFCLDAEVDEATLVKAMHNYLTSADVAGNTVEVDENNFLYADLLMNEGGAFDGQLPNGSMYTDVTALTVDKYGRIDQLAPVLPDEDDEAYEKTATYLRTIAVKYLNEYKIDLDNMAIKYNFLNYLDDATQNLVRSQLSYMKAQNANGTFVLTYNMINLLTAGLNGDNTAISIKKFQDEMGIIPFNEYMVYYREVLELIASDKQAEHVEKLLLDSNGHTVTFADTYIYNSSNPEVFDKTIGILSTQDLNWNTTALNNVVRPVDLLTPGTTYVGSAVRNYDSIVNVNTQYKVTGSDGYENLY